MIYNDDTRYSGEVQNFILIIMHLFKNICEKLHKKNDLNFLCFKLRKVQIFYFILEYSKGE